MARHLDHFRRPVLDFPRLYGSANLVTFAANTEIKHGRRAVVRWLGIAGYWYWFGHAGQFTSDRPASNTLNVPKVFGYQFDRSTGPNFRGKHTVPQAAAGTDFHFWRTAAHGVALWLAGAWFPTPGRPGATREDVRIPRIGGYPVLGMTYDPAGGRRVINVEEAARVRAILALLSSTVRSH